METLEMQAAPCGPIWDMFCAVRLQLCKHILDPLVSGCDILIVQIIRNVKICFQFLRPVVC